MHEITKFSARVNHYLDISARFPTHVEEPRPRRDSAAVVSFLQGKAGHDLAIVRYGINVMQYFKTRLEYTQHGPAAVVATFE